MRNVVAMAALAVVLSGGLVSAQQPEMRGIGHKGYENVAADRAGVTYAFTSARVKEAVARRGIKLISYAEVADD